MAFALYRLGVLVNKYGGNSSHLSNHTYCEHSYLDTVAPQLWRNSEGNWTRFQQTVVTDIHPLVKISDILS